MKQIFGTEALQMLPCQNGFVFVIKQEEYDGKAVIAYKMLDFEHMNMTAVTRSVYLLAKFGNCFEQFEDNPEQFLSLRSVTLPDHRLLVTDAAGNTVAYTAEGNICWQGSLAYEGAAPDSMAAAENCFWASYPEKGAVIRYGVQSLRPELRIGGGNSSLPTPEGLFFYHEQLLICCKDEKAILQLNPQTFAVEEYHSFAEPVHRYFKYHANEIVLLDSGIYKL